MYNSYLKSGRGSLVGCLHGKHLHLVLINALCIDLNTPCFFFIGYIVYHGRGFQVFIGVWAFIRINTVHIMLWKICEILMY